MLNVGYVIATTRCRMSSHISAVALHGTVHTSIIAHNHTCHLCSRKSYITLFYNSATISSWPAMLASSFAVNSSGSCQGANVNIPLLCREESTSYGYLYTRICTVL